MSENKLNVFVPAAGRYLVKPDAAETVSPGGIHIPSAAEIKHERGVIIAAGSDKINEHGVKHKQEYMPDDHVLYAKFSGNEVKIDGVDYIVLAEQDILGYFTDEE